MALEIRKLVTLGIGGGEFWGAGNFLLSCDGYTDVSTL